MSRIFFQPVAATEHHDAGVECQIFSDEGQLLASHLMTIDGAVIRMHDMQAAIGARDPREDLQDLVEARKLRTFVDPTDASDAEALGLVVASWADYDGERICEAFLAALTDANFHSLAATIEPIIRADLGD